jgi:hypothetical protein
MTSGRANHHLHLIENLLMSDNGDITRTETLEWDRYKNKSAEDALKLIYDDVQASSSQKRGWYWNSIKKKRIASTCSRGVALTLLVLGTALPLLAGLSNDPGIQLYCTQLGVTLLAIAGLIQIADSAFGWSSGWMRYITTVTAMEGAGTDFELTWNKCLLSKTTAVNATDVVTLFEYAEHFERDLIKLLNDETNGWITEFNAGISLLNSTIKAQREETQKQLGEMRAASTAARKAQEPGAIDLVLTFQADPKRVSIFLDDSQVSDDFIDTTWSSDKLTPGIHKVIVQELDGSHLESQRSVVVEAGKVSNVEIKLPF